MTDKCTCGWKVPFCILHVAPEGIQQYFTEISLQMFCPDCGKMLNSTMEMSEEQKMVSAIKEEEEKWNEPLRWESVYSLATMLDRQTIQNLIAKRRYVEDQIYRTLQPGCYH
jgi:hypothetical protein